MTTLLDRWLTPALFANPLQRMQARLLQRFALIVLAAALLSLPTSLVAQSAIERAVSDALDAGWRTGDLASPDDPDDGLVVVGTSGFATAVVDRLTAAAEVPA